MMQGSRALAIAMVVALLIAASPATAAASGEPGVHLTKMTIEPDGRDFNVTVHYTTGWVTKLFSLLFGANVVRPAIVDQLAAFGDVKLVSIDTNGQTAKLVARNQSRLSNGMYLYDRGVKFPAPIDVIEVKGKAVDRPLTIRNAAMVPTFFYNL